LNKEVSDNMSDKPFELIDGDGDGKGTVEALETAEELQAVQKKLSDLARPGAVTFTKEQVSLFNKMVQVPDTPDPKEVFLRLIPMLDFKSDDERAKHMRAFNEADRLGMDLWWNIRYTLSLCAINRGGHKSSRIGALLESFTHQTHTYNTANKGKHYESSGSRSPLQ